ncbi:MAG: tail fiber protein, partial [Clostridiales bacterium]|nr:tail fiber protein [Clostridiales bacterium]
MAKQTEHYNFTVPDITDAADITQIGNVINQIDEVMHNIDVEAAAKAPQNHASTENIYGTGTGVDYGHVMLSDSISSVSNDTNGIAATPAAAKAAYDKAVEVGNALKTDLNSEITDRTTADQDIINLLSGKWDNEIQVEWEYKGAGNRVFGSGDTYDFECITPFRIFIPSSSNSAEKTLFTLGNGDLQIEYGGSIAYLSIQGNEADGISYSSVKTEHAHLGNLDILIKLGDMNLQNDSSGDGTGVYSTMTFKRTATNLKGLISDYKGYLPSKEQIGLGNVDNTSDEDKPVSAAQQSALNLKSNKWVAMTTGYSTRYSVTLNPAPTALEVGMTITIIPHVTSTSGNVTLNVNGLGAKHICQRGLNETFTPYAESFLTANKPVTLMYDGTCWIDTTYTLPEWKDVLNPPSSFTPSSHAS